MKISPQEGPQEVFLGTSADIAIYGGAAGGGKTWSLLMEPLRHVTGNPQFSAVIFRRNTTQVRNPGAMWDESFRLYPLIGGEPRQQALEWVWPNGGRIKFAHLEHEKTVFDWQGAQIAFLGFDELCHFSRSQFFYMLSRNRSMCGVRPYVRATCNPDADSWVAEFISWWIDQETGFAIPERSGIIRWFVRIGDSIVWADSRKELIEAHGDEVEPKSATFIPAKLSDNRALMDADPAYKANLMALSIVERERLLNGNWKIRPAAGLYFQRAWCEVVDAIPAGLRFVRYWDLAATEKTDSNDPDWTVGVRMGYDGQTFYVVDRVKQQSSPRGVEQAIKNTASQDGRSTRIGLPQDPGQAGKSQAQYFAGKLAGYSVSSRIESGDKITRFSPFSAQCEAGNVKILRAAWNEDFFTTLESFPEALHDDDVDACSGAFNLLAGRSELKITREAINKAIGAHA